MHEEVSSFAKKTWKPLFLKMRCAPPHKELGIQVVLSAEIIRELRMQKQRRIVIVIVGTLNTVYCFQFALYH